MTGQPLHVGFIPLVDAAALIVAVDKDLPRRKAWTSRWCGSLLVECPRQAQHRPVRRRASLGARRDRSSLGLGHVKVPIVAPFNLGLNGNAITVSPALHAAIMSEIDGDGSIRWRQQER